MSISIRMGDNPILYGGGYLLIKGEDLRAGKERLIFSGEPALFDVLNYLLRFFQFVEKSHPERFGIFRMRGDLGGNFTPVLSCFIKIVNHQMLLDAAVMERLGRVGKDPQRAP